MLLDTNTVETVETTAQTEVTPNTPAADAPRKPRINNGERKPRSNDRNNNGTLPGFEEKIVQIKRISKTTKGGRSMRFSALVVIGDKKGTVGYGIGKSVEVPTAIQKAIKNANKNLFKVKMTKRGTLYHEVNIKQGATRVLLKPAQRGTGIIAGGAVRQVVELAGYHDVYTKSLGSNTPSNVIRATIEGLCNQLTPNEVKALRAPIQSTKPATNKPVAATEE